MFFIHVLRKRVKVGLGSGHRHSKNFMEFVQRQRQILKTEANLCESACKKILNYSNNFLYRKQRTNDMVRYTRYILCSILLRLK